MKKGIRLIKQNRFAAAIALVYAALLLLAPATMSQAISNSSYYLKEMLMIMPVIFILTALLDGWVPKETIGKYLGKESKGKGIFLAFLLGSVSAGPIYAAFPICTMLHKKGASIQNIVIILSSWAVIKIPMLLNEAKFLGMQFMLLRWALSIVAILFFAWMSAKIVKDRDLIQAEPVLKQGVNIHHDACMGCTLCTRTYSALFAMEGNKAIVKAYEHVDEACLQEAMNACMVKAITYQKQT
ncbi:MAG: permease [Erysipelotrichaceae bacterium]